MHSALLVIGGVLVGLLVLLALIVRLSARPDTGRRAGSSASRSWVVDADRPRSEASSPLSATGTSEIPATR